MQNVKLAHFDNIYYDAILCAAKVTMKRCHPCKSKQSVVLSWYNEISDSDETRHNNISAHAKASVVFLLTTKLILTWYNNRANSTHICYVSDIVLCLKK